MTAKELNVVPAWRLESREPERQWLIEKLWGAESVGVVGGEPKCCKSFLALEMAVAAAAGGLCLDRYPVRRTGPVLLFAAEDALHVVRVRLEAACARRGIDLTGLPVWVITSPRLRIDEPKDREALRRTVDRLRPVLVILDPFVRLHGVDENASGDVAPLLDYLRSLQRSFHCAVAVVHHAKKGGGGLRAGQALRGSGEFHAWVDSSLHLRRRGSVLTLSSEHRAHPSDVNERLALVEAGKAAALRLVDPPADSSAKSVPVPSTTKLEDVIPDLLRSMGPPVSIRRLRERCRVRTATLCAALNDLASAGRVVKSSGGWSPGESAAAGPTAGAES